MTCLSAAAHLLCPSSVARLDSVFLSPSRSGLPVRPSSPLHARFIYAPYCEGGKRRSLSRTPLAASPQRWPPLRTHPICGVGLAHRQQARQD